MSATGPTIGPPGGADGRGQCRIRAHPRLPSSPRHIAIGSNSFNSCSGKPTASSRPPRRPATTADYRSDCIATSLSGPIQMGQRPGPIRSWWQQGHQSARLPTRSTRRDKIGGLAPVNPLALRRRCFAPFVAAIRANMRHAGILRMDHVMSLDRLYWIPVGMAATEERM